MANVSVRTTLSMIDFATLLGAAGTVEFTGARKIRVATDVDDYVDFIGTGFTYDSEGNPTGGVVKSITSVVDGVVQATANQFSVALTTVFAALAGGDAETILQLFFSTNDRMTGGDGDDVLYGFGGTDTLTGGAGVDTAYGGDGNDVFKMQDGEIDTAVGGAGNDRYYIDGIDSITEVDGEGTDTAYIVGTYVLDEGNSIENLNGFGRDAVSISGNSARNTIKGGSGDDTLSGLGDRDTISGGNGNDVIFGGDEYDRLFGDGGADVIYGDDGTDRIDGGTGNDDLYGGGADGVKDTFIFTVAATSFGRDTIHDFEDGIDRIQINGFADFAAATAGGMTISNDSNGDTIVKFTGPIATITLLGMDQSQITAADFVFVA